MSIYYGKLCSVILKQCFGETVQLVADCLFDAISRSTANLCKTTKLSRREVTNALAILIKFRLVKFAPSLGEGTTAEYSLNRDEIFFILRFPRYVHLTQTKFGNIGAAIIEELLRSGCNTASSVLLKCFANPDNTETLAVFRDVFNNMVKANYVIRVPGPKPSDEPQPIPELHLEEYEAYNPPELDLGELTQIHAGSVIRPKDADIYWQTNFQRFHQDFRDTVMISAIERKLGATAGECFKYILKVMYTRTHPWQSMQSNPFTFVEVKQALEKNSKNLEAVKYLDQFVSVIAEDSLGFIRKVGEMGGGQYVVDMEKCFEELSLACIENVITEKFGSKASRIFRVIRRKKFIEQEDIQKEAMIPSKEAKLSAYNLFQEQFIQIKTIRKAGGGGAGPAKSFYLFHLKTKQVVKMLLDTCYKSLYNTVTRSNFEKAENKRLIDKSQKLESIVDTMKERGDSDEYIAEILETLTPPEREILEKVKTRIKSLSNAELAIDETIFLLQMYIFHTTAVVKKVVT